MTFADTRYCPVGAGNGSKVRTARDLEAVHGQGAASSMRFSASIWTFVLANSCVLLARSGCGKTTLLRIVAGLDRQSAGSVEIRQQATRARPLNSMVFQGQSIFPWMNVRDNVAFGLKAQGIPRGERLSDRRAVYSQVGLPGLRTHFPTNFLVA